MYKKAVISTVLIMGVILTFGSGNAADEWALEAVKRNAARGDAEAQYEMGNLYKRGREMPQDFQAAFDLFNKSAMQGYIRAQISLAFMHLYGKGTPRDPVKAYAWFGVAAAQGDDFAKINLKDLGSKMAPDLVSAAQKEAERLAASIDQQRQ